MEEMDFKEWLKYYAGKEYSYDKITFEDHIRYSEYKVNFDEFENYHKDE